MHVKIYHNPRCSKSRQALDIIKQEGIEPEVILYLKQAPDQADLNNILELMNIQDPRDIMRKNESVYKELELDQHTGETSDLVKIICENPILLERPVVITDKGALIGRPPEKVQTIL
jgi:arsenate reductase